MKALVLVAELVTPKSNSKILQLNSKIGHRTRNEFNFHQTAEALVERKEKKQLVTSLGK